MAVSFANTWKNVLDKLQNVLRSEFGNTLPVYVGEVNEKGGSQYLRLDPVSSELLEYNSSSETREFSINVFLYFGDKSDSRTTLDAILRLTSRVESLVFDNVAMLLADHSWETLTTNWEGFVNKDWEDWTNPGMSNLFNCRMESTTLDAEEDSESYVVLWDFKAMHRGNQS